MRYFATVLALASLVAAPVLADQLGGIAGTAIDAKTGQPLAHATLYYYRSPYVENSTRIMKLATNDRGFFSDITLEPGRYVIVARYPNKVEGCAIDDVIGGETTRMKLTIGRNAIMCSGPRVHSALIDPNAGASVYRI
jgi:hypothetical protein